MRSLGNGQRCAGAGDGDLERGTGEVEWSGACGVGDAAKEENGEYNRRAE